MWGHTPPKASEEAYDALVVEGHDGSLAGTVSSKWSKGSGGPAGDETQNMVAFSMKDYGADADVISPTIRAMNYHRSHPNAGGQVAIAFKSSYYTRGKDGAPSALAPPQSADADKGDQDTLICAAWDPTQLTHPENRSKLDFGGPAVTHAATAQPQNIIGFSALDSEAIIRRITPRECERLFGLPDDWTLTEMGSASRDTVEIAAQALYLVQSGYPEAVAFQLAKSPDGPRFRALGNAMAVPVIGWILRRITDTARSPISQN